MSRRPPFSFACRNNPTGFSRNEPPKPIERTHRMAWKFNAARKLDEKVQSESVDTRPHLELSVDPGEQAVETVGVFLQNIGQFSFDVQDEDAETISELFDQWQKHLLLGMPRPGLALDREAKSIDRRDWPGVRQFFAHHRRSEKRFVDSS